jgi:hypothetical protein
MTLFTYRLGRRALRCRRGGVFLRHAAMTHAIMPITRWR